MTRTKLKSAGIFGYILVINPVDFATMGFCRKLTLICSRAFSFHCCEIYLAHRKTTKLSNLKPRSLKEQTDKSPSGFTVAEFHALAPWRRTLMISWLFLSAHRPRIVRVRCGSTIHAVRDVGEVHELRIRKAVLAGAVRKIRSMSSYLFVRESTKHTLKENDSLSIKGCVMYHPVA